MKDTKILIIALAVVSVMLVFTSIVNFYQRQAIVQQDKQIAELEKTRDHAWQHNEEIKAENLRLQFKIRENGIKFVRYLKEFKLATPEQVEWANEADAEITEVKSRKYYHESVSSPVWTDTDSCSAMKNGQKFRKEEKP